MLYILPPNFDDEDLKKQIKEIVVNPQLNEIFMNSPDGTKWKVTITDAGNFNAEEVN